LNIVEVVFGLMVLSDIVKHKTCEVI